MIYPHINSSSKEKLYKWFLEYINFFPPTDYISQLFIYSKKKKIYLWLYFVIQLVTGDR